MRLGIDGEALRLPLSGVGQYVHHLCHELEQLWPWRPLGDNYPPEDELEQRIGGRADTFTAPKGTIIFCNTSGFHRGGFAKAKLRVLATLTWDSPASLKALSERNFAFVSSNGAALDPAQRYALT